MARRMIVLFVACALVPMSLLALFAIQRVGEQIEQQAEAYLGRVARDTGSFVVDVLNMADAELLELGQRVSATDASPESWRTLLDEWHRPRLRGAALFEDGSLIAASPSWSPRLPRLSGAQEAHLAKGEALLFSQADAAGTVEPMLLRHLPGSSLTDRLLAVQIAGDRIFSRHDFAFSDIEFCLGLMGEKLIASTLLDPRDLVSVLTAHAAAPGRSARFEARIEGASWLAARRTTFLQPQYLADVAIIVGIRKDEIWSAVSHFRTVFGLLTLLSTAAALLLAKIQIRRFLKPLGVLRAAAERVAAGDYGSKTALRSGDELEELSCAFDEMAARIQIRTSELEHANQAKSDFLANVSHELRTPMTAILGYMELCMEPTATPAERMNHMRVVADSGRHLLEVIEDILDVSRIEAGRLVIVRERVETIALIADVANLIAVSARAKGLEFELLSEGPLPTHVQTDPTRVRQVLFNLLGNAVKFTQEGRVVLAVGVVESSGQLSFEVRDTGCGIASGKLDEMFEPFAQENGLRSRSHGGTGLGLAIAREVARALGGDVRGASEPGKGSSFVFTCDPGPLGQVEHREQLLEAVMHPQGPAADPLQPVAPAPALPVQAPHGGHRILLVEDSPVNLRLIRAMLEREGYEVDPAQDGQVGVEKALAALEANAPHDLVVTDIQMPEMDGYELSRRLRSAGFEGPIVALTAHTMPGERERCLAAGCDDFASKPITRPVLAELVSRLLDGRQSGVVAR